MYNRSDH